MLILSCGIEHIAEMQRIKDDLCQYILIAIKAPTAYSMVLWLTENLPEMDIKDLCLIFLHVAAPL